MALGIEQNNLAPQLIQSSGQALVQGIRQIGQQVSSHLTEMQVKRDLGAMAQEMQGLNPQSNDFPIQLTQLVSKHPLAARDERGQMALSILGKAHGQWQAGEAEARAFNRAMTMQGMRAKASQAAAIAQEERIRSRPVEVSGVGLADPLTGEVLIPEKPRVSASTNAPRVLAPGAMMVDPMGNKIAENPKPVMASMSEARMKKKNKVDLLMRQDAATRAEFGRLESRRDALSKQRMEIKADDPNAAYLDNTIRAIEEEAKALKDRRMQIQKAIETIELVPAAEPVEPEPELGVVPEIGVAPPIGAVAPPAAAPNEMVLVIDPSGVPGRVKASQLEAALANGYKRR